MKFVQKILVPLLYSAWFVGIYAFICTLDVGSADGATLLALVSTSFACLFLAELLNDDAIMFRK